MPDAADVLADIRPGPTSVTTGLPSLPQGWQSGPTTFVEHAKRFLGLSVELDQMGLNDLPERMVEVLHQRLLVNVGAAADKIIKDAQDSLYKPDDFPLSKHGLDTGRMRDELVAKIIDEVGVLSYDFSSGAEYWVYVEFGHMLRDGSWWPGYHFMTTALLDNYTYVQSMVRNAWHETVTILAAQARSPGGGGMAYPASSASLAGSATAAGMGPVGPGGTPLEQDL